MGLTRRLEEHGDRPALIFPGRTPIPYRDLALRVAAVAAEFGPEKKLVAVAAEPTEHAVISYLAAMHGRHAVALIPPCDASALDDFVADYSPEIICRRVDAHWRCRTGAGESNGALHPDLAVLLGTSGSTGKSRYVRLSAAAIEANARAIVSYLELSHRDRAALILPFHYSYGLSVLNSHLEAGASIYFPKHGASHSAFAQEMREASCTNISGVPYSFEMMDHAGFRRHDLPELRFMTVAGGRMQQALAETFRRHLADNSGCFFMMYGQTEATARIAYVPPGELEGNLGSIGIAIPGGKLRLADEDGRPIEQNGEPGELIYSGPNVMMGYAHRRADLARAHEVADLRTGDIAKRDDRGFYSIVGRRKRMSKIAGLRLSHDAIETALEKAGIAAAVVGDDERILAMVTTPNVDDNEVLQVMMAASGLPRPHLEVARATSLRKLASGKVDYASLQARLRAPRQQTAMNVLDAFRNAFYPRQVGPSDTFEKLGGDSLLYVQLSLTLERKLGSLPQGWETMPVGDLARTAEPRNHNRSIDSQLVLRAAAILLVVIHHATLWPIPGGAATLVMLVGFSLARFQRHRLFAGDGLTVLRPLAANLALYAPIVAGFSLARREVLWPSVFLSGNLGFAAPPHMVPYLYWFVEAYAQTILLWVILFSIPQARRIADAMPLASGIFVLAIAVAAKFLTPLVWYIGGPQIFTLPDILYLAILGWCLYFLDTPPKRKAFFAVATVLCLVLAWWGGNWTGSWVKFMLVLGAVFVLLFIPRITLPTWAAPLILPVSAASYHIYLFHRVIPDWLLPQLDLGTQQPFGPAAAISIGLASGLAVFWSQKQFIGWLAYRRASRLGWRSHVVGGPLEAAE